MTQAAGMFSDGAAYERLMGRWSRLAGDHFLQWVDAPESQRWLDVGCGNGAFTEVIAERAAPTEVVGIDPSSAQLDFARTRPKLRNTMFHVGDALALPFPDSRFDVVVMALVIAFVPDPGKAVSELARVAKPGGIVASYMWDLRGFGAPLSPMSRALGRIGCPASQPPQPHAASLDAMQKMWGTAGLVSIETTRLPVAISFADFNDFWESHTQPVGPQAKTILSLSPDMRERLQAELQASLPREADGRIVYEAVANAVKGCKPR